MILATPLDPIGVTMMKTHPVGPLLIGLVLTCSACTVAPKPAPAPTLSSATSAPTTFACDPGKTEVTWLNESRTKTLISAVKVTVSPAGGQTKAFSETQLVTDTPVKPSATGFEGAPAWLDRLAESYRTSKNAGATTADSPKLPATKSLLGDNLKHDGTYVGYVGIIKIAATFTITCSAPAAHVSGNVQLWDNAAEGVLACTIIPPADTFAAIATQHCGSS